MLIIGYKPARKLKAKYEKKGYTFRWARLHRIPALELDGWVIAHRRLNKKVIPIQYAELTLMGRSTHNNT